MNHRQTQLTVSGLMHLAEALDEEPVDLLDELKEKEVVDEDEASMILILLEEME